MYEKTLEQIIDTTTLAAKIEAAAAKYRGSYAPDYGVYMRLLEVYEKFGELVYLNNGDMEIDNVESVDMIKIAAMVPGLDLYEERLSLFIELVEMVDDFESYQFDEDTLVVKVGVKGLWKSV